MSRIRVTKQFRFEAAHALKGHDGACRNIHGHSYELSVTILGTPNADPGSSKFGMVMDFGDLKKLIHKSVIDLFDHALILYDEDQAKDLHRRGEPFSNIILVPYQPTSENMLLDFAGRIGKLLPAGITLHNLRLRETAASFAEWHASDNF
jgi:6-pyruvoyltetrahydropterin/6-carboxytetrahydropterin synthase